MRVGKLSSPIPLPTIHSGITWITRLHLKISILSRVQNVKETQSTYVFFEESLDTR